MLDFANLIFGSINIPFFLKDALLDSFAILPSLFIIFVIIEVSENYFCNRLELLPKYTGLAGPFVGGLLALVPQCGFSVIAATLYFKKLITKGTLIAVFISTSDEAIPTLLAYPAAIKAVLPILFTKVLLAILVGYTVDFVFKPIRKTECKKIEQADIEDENGCCDEKVFSKKNIFVHPLKHTIHIFAFILIITCALNYSVSHFDAQLNTCLLTNSLWQPVLAAIVGLIPNCAISVLITMLYIKQSISFGSVIAGLSSSAGLGLLVLLRKNDSLKDTLFIVFILLLSSIIAGILLQVFSINI